MLCLYFYPTFDKNHTILESSDKKFDEMSMSEYYISRLNNDSNICFHKTFVVSGWAKADSAFVAEDEKYEANSEDAIKKQGNITGSEVPEMNKYEQYLANRKFIRFVSY